MKTIMYLQKTTETSRSMQKFAGAQQLLASRGYNVRKIFADRCSPSELRDLIPFWHALGVIVECSGQRPRISEKTFGNIPVVFLDVARESESSTRLTVSYDIRATCHLAARELLSLDCLAYGYAGYGPRVPWSEERRRIFAKAMELNGQKISCFDLNPATVSPSIFYRKLCAWLDAFPKPYAIFAADDAYALHVHSAAQNVKHRIPSDMAILGVDDESSSLVSPGISSIQLDFLGAGRLAAELLLQKLENPLSTLANVHFGPVQLLRRSSTRRLRSVDSKLSGILERIRDAAPHGLTASEVASWLPCSRRLVEIRFREATGHSILEEISAAKIERAKVLLTSTSTPISVVAELCGYKTFNAFRDAFKSITGQTPRTWRKSL